MELIAVLFLIIIGVYCLLLAQLILGFDKVKLFSLKKVTAKTTFSIIVPFRNEEKKLPKLLHSFSKLNYPKELFEIIVVDDNSKDKSARIFNKWRFENGLIQTTLLDNLRLSNSPKKDALMRAVPVVKNQWIVTTDADCVVKKNWLWVLDEFIQSTSAEMVVGSVLYKTKNNWFHHFQHLDLLALQGVTMGSFGIGKPFMCNGANFAYTKNFFNDLSGFSGNMDQASGDDVFLLQKAVAKYPEKVHYLKNHHNIVTTTPENRLYNLFMQRVRWASKSTDYNSVYAKALAISTFFANLSLVVAFFLFLFAKLNGTVLIIGFILKYTVEYIIILKSNYFLTKNRFVFILASSFIYPVFGSLVGLYSLMGSFYWKGRKFKKN